MELVKYRGGKPKVPIDIIEDMTYGEWLKEKDHFSLAPYNVFGLFGTQGSRKSTVARDLISVIPHETLFIITSDGSSYPEYEHRRYLYDWEMDPEDPEMERLASKRSKSVVDKIAWLIEQTPEKNRKNILVILDDCQQELASDKNIAKILANARHFKLNVVLMYQNLVMCKNNIRCLLTAVGWMSSVDNIYELENFKKSFCMVDKSTFNMLLSKYPETNRMVVWQKRYLDAKPYYVVLDKTINPYYIHKSKKYQSEMATDSLYPYY